MTNSNRESNCGNGAKHREGTLTRGGAHATRSRRAIERYFGLAV
jgi:hypothetical protein